MIVLEEWQQRGPVAACDLESYQEYAANRVNCLFASLYDFEQLVDNVERTLKDPDVGPGISEEGIVPPYQISWQEMTQRVDADIHQWYTPSCAHRRLDRFVPGGVRILPAPHHCWIFALVPRRLVTPGHFGHNTQRYSSHMSRLLDRHVLVEEASFYDVEFVIVCRYLIGCLMAWIELRTAGFAGYPMRNAQALARALTCVLYKWLIGSRSAPPSPYLVK